MDKSSFKRIYETKYGWVGRIGGKEYETFYFITVSQGIVSKEIAFRLTKLDVEKNHYFQWRFKCSRVYS